MAAFAFAAAIRLVLTGALPFAGAPALAGALPLAGVPTRGVVSLNLCTDELVLLVVDPRRIQSVSYLSHLREETPLWRRARAFRANDGTMLAAAAMRPGLVVTMGTGGRDRAQLARAVGARLLELPYPQSIADVARSLREVGRATGGQARAERIAALLEDARRTAPARRYDAMWVDGAGRTLSPGGLGAEWMRLAGLAQRAVPGDRITLEAMWTHPPAVLVRSRYRARQMSSATTWARHPGAARISSRGLATDGRRWTCAGPALLPEILRLRGLLVP